MSAPLSPDPQMSALTEPPCRSPAPDPVQMMDNARRASAFLKALSHETRLVLLCLIAERERPVGEFEEILNLRQPVISQHLARLRADGMVTTRREGKLIYYRISNPDVQRMIATIYDIFCHA